MRNPINQPICIRCLMMLVFLLMSLGISAQVRWGDPTSAAAFVEVNEWTMNWSNRGGAYPELNNPNKATVTYSSSNTDVATIDADKVKFPLTLRPVSTGDRFVPFGMKGSKLVSDYLTDQKVSILDKRRQLVLVDSTGTIIWLVGRRTDNRFKISNDTKRALRITIK